MRKITKDAVNAFMSGKDFKRGNTKVKNGVMYLHGNAIAKRDNLLGINITLAGWNTATTRERLNGLISPKYRIFQKDFTPYLESRNGLAMFEMGSRRWYSL